MPEETAANVATQTSEPEANQRPLTDFERGVEHGMELGIRHADAGFEFRTGEMALILREPIKGDEPDGAYAVGIFDIPKPGTLIEPYKDQTVACVIAMGRKIGGQWLWTPPNAASRRMIASALLDSDIEHNTWHRVLITQMSVGSLEDASVKCGVMNGEGPGVALEMKLVDGQWKPADPVTPAPPAH